jgi:hypothetical protein
MYNLFNKRSESKYNSIDIYINSDKIGLDGVVDLSEYKFLGINKIEITALEFPSIFYNIVDTDIVTNLGTCTVSLGNYSPITIASEIQSKLQTLNTGFTCVYSTATRKISINNSLVQFSISGMQSYNLRMREMLGLDSKTNNIALTNSYEFPNVSEPNIYSEFAVVSNVTNKVKQSNTLETDSGSLSVLATIPIVYDSKTLQLYDKYISRPVVFAQTIVVNKLTLIIVDPATGLSVNTGGIKWSCTLTLYGKI